MTAVRPKPKELDDDGIKVAEKAYQLYDRAVDELVQRAVADAGFAERLLGWAKSLTQTNCGYASYHVGQRLIKWERHIRKSHANEKAQRATP